MCWLEKLLEGYVVASTESNRVESPKKFYGGLPRPDGKTTRIKLGICALEKKSQSCHMKQLIKRLEETYVIDVVVFSEKTILLEPIESWPQCHCLIAFFSSGFPLEKAEAYAKKYKPFLVNRLEPQHLLKDRRHVYVALAAIDVPIPKYLCMNRSSYSPSGIPVVPNQEEDLKEFEDYIEIKGKKLYKPFVEKPADADDHGVYIYYPRSAGGGSKRLFRKTGNRSSQFFPDENRIRRNGSFLYEEFVPTEGTDVKVYVVTKNYAHAEARKSPVVDGRVIRHKNGAEVRYPVRLSSYEKGLARKTSFLFGQTVCGFDLLRNGRKTYICDVNGWSFVKNNHHFYDDAARLLSELIHNEMGISIVAANTERSFVSNACISKDSCGNESRQELRCVIGVIRHGDRTPKQKMKVVVTDERFTSLFEKYANEIEGDELKLKTAAQLGDVLRATKGALSDLLKKRGGLMELEEGDIEAANKLIQMKTVLEMHGKFKGINRKVQLKVLKRASTVVVTDSLKEHLASPIKEGSVVKAKLVLKWGGVLTSLGRSQAEKMGRSFREQIYTGKDGLLRLHSTFRHDLKISSSDEGRVQVTAAAFAKGLLDLQGHLTPILASLVQKNANVNGILDDASNAKADLENVKRKLHQILLKKSVVDDTDTIQSINPTGAASISRALRALKRPREQMERLQYHIRDLVFELETMITYINRENEEKDHQDQNKLYEMITGHMLVSEVDDPSIEQAISPVASKKSKHLETNRKNETVPRMISLMTSEVTGSSRTGCEEDSSQSSSQPESVGVRNIPLEEEKALCSEGGSAAASLQKSSSRSFLSSKDALHLGLARWRKLELDFYNAKKATYDLSKIPDIFDCAKYDLLHSPALSASDNLQAVYTISKMLADIIVPQEYGMTAKEKLKIGKTICKSLLQKIRLDIWKTIDKECEKAKVNMRSSEVDCAGNDSLISHETASEETSHVLDSRYAESMGIENAARSVRTRLYFTSESHIHTLLNSLRWASIIPESAPTFENDDLTETRTQRPVEIEKSRLAKIGELSELGYLTHLVIRLFEVSSCRTDCTQKECRSSDCERRFKISVDLSSGAPVDMQNTAQHDELGVSRQNSGQATFANSFRCYPCEETVSLWQDISAADFDQLLCRVLYSDIDYIEE